MVHPGSIVILDFGGQYAHLIANRVRRLGAYSEIRVAETPAEELKTAAGIILSGGPQSVYDPNSPQADRKIFDLNIPILGLCYGHQWIASVLGGRVAPGKTKEYGSTPLEVMKPGHLFKGLPKKFTVWMSHGDEVVELPLGFDQSAASFGCKYAAFADEERKIFGAQFHLEVTHTEHGMEILEKFVMLCEPTPWSVESFEERIGNQIKKEVGQKKVFMLVSGGVDSTVAFTLLNKVLGAERVVGLLVDTGLMRKNEVRMIQEAFKELGITNLHVEDASEEFFRNLKDIYEPEQKRKIIGQTFLDVQRRVSEKMGLAGGQWPVASSNAGKSHKPQATSHVPSDQWLLGQGTIYPDTIETGGTKHADHIKTHHNRVDAVQKMIDAGLVIEPLKELYKDEVRHLAEELGLPHALVWRHPFPGPGLGVRILCAQKADEAHHADAPVHTPHAVLPVRSVGVQGDGRTYRHALALFSDRPCHITDEHLRLATTIPNTNPALNRVLLCTSRPDVPVFTFTPGYLTRERADLLREADAIVHDEMTKAGLYEKIWQFPVVLLPFGTRSGGPTSASATAGGQSIVLRPIVSTDAMTANAMPVPEKVLQVMTDRLCQLDGIDLVFMDLTNKPPATIEWE